MTCTMCGEPMPRYEPNIVNGFTKPVLPGSPEEQACLSIKQGPTGVTIEARDIPVCAACYLKEFARIHPGADLPEMPRRVD
jgi:hypothetical protein